MKIQINQEVDVDDLIEEIEFAKCISLVDNSTIGSIEYGIPLEVLYNILKRYFPQIQTYIDESIQTNIPI